MPGTYPWGTQSYTQRVYSPHLAWDGRELEEGKLLITKVIRWKAWKLFFYFFDVIGFTGKIFQNIHLPTIFIIPSDENQCRASKIIILFCMPNYLGYKFLGRWGRCLEKKPFEFFTFWLWISTKLRASAVASDPAMHLKPNWTFKILHIYHKRDKQKLE